MIQNNTSFKVKCTILG